MSYTPANDLLTLSQSAFDSMTDARLGETYKRLTAAHTGDATLAQSDKIARLERAANAEVSERGLWSEVYGE